jgi:hypothetical protein
MSIDINITEIQRRLKAVLSYDGIVENEMHLYLAKVLQVSSAVTKRMLSSKHRTILSRGIDAADALNISVDWLYFGRLDRFSDQVQKNRTLRIHVQVYKGYSKEITNRVMRFNFAFIAGITRAKNLMDLVGANKMSYVDAVMMF